MIFNISRFKRKGLALSISAALALAAAGTAIADGSDELLTLAIKSQSADSSLLKLAKASGIQIVVPSSVSAGKVLPELSGDYPLSDALDLLLSGSGLEYEFLSDTSIIIKQADDEGSSENEEVAEEIVVTGSLLRKTNPISPVTTMTREDFDKLGASSLEDVVRSLPQNFSSLNAASSLGNTNEIFNNAFTPNAQGQSVANLRGLGGNSTLVLVNGRRRAGAATAQGNAFDLSTIPLTAVERVEILLDGASAIYGADAVGGVINIILRKEDYTTATTSVDYANIGNGGNEYGLSQYFNYSWGDGRLSVTLSHQESDPVSAAKAGQTTSDLTSRGGTNWLTSGRSPVSSPGFVSETNGFAATLPRGSLPASNDGTTPWVLTDLVSFTATNPVDVSLNRDVTPETKKQSVSFDIEHQFTESLQAFADMVYSTNDTATVRSIPGLGPTNGIVVPASNAFNPLGRDVFVSYGFQQEAASGLIPAFTENFSDRTAFSVSTGLNWDLPFKDWRLTAVAGYSEDKGDSSSTGIDTASDAWSDLLDSSDPATAVNLFGNGTAQTELLATAFGTSFQSTTETELKSLNLKLEGGLADLPGGEIRGAIGGEFRREGIAIASPNTPIPLGELGREVTAWFVQLNIPLVGPDNELPGIKTLLLDISARSEEYRLLDPVAAGFGVPGTGSKSSFSNTSPRVGLAWKPIDTLTIRTTYTEAFVVPSFSELLSPQNPPFPSITFDWVTGQTLFVPTTFGGNPELQPETSENITVGFDWVSEVVDGLTISATYNNIKFTDRIQSFFPAPGFTGPGNGPAIFSDPRIVTRDGAGNLIGFNSTPINVAARELEAVDFDIGYVMGTDTGDYSIRLAGTCTGELFDQVISGGAEQSLVNTAQGPSQWVGKLSLGWNSEGYGANMDVNYSSSYEFASGSSVATPVEHWSTIDLSGYYEMDNGWKVNGGIRNLLNNQFPFVDSSFRPFDTSRVDSRGRVVYVKAEKQFDF